LWITQHALLAEGNSRSRGFVGWTFLFLGAVSFIPFPALLLSEHHDQMLSVVIFSATLAAAAIALIGIWRVGERQRPGTGSALAASGSPQIDTRYELNDSGVYMRTPGKCLALPTTVLILVVACSFPGIKRLHEPRAETVDLEVLLNPHQLSDSTRRFLEKEGVLGTYHDDAIAVIERLYPRLVAEPSSPALRLSLIEMCADTGGLQLTSASGRAMGFYLSAAELAFAEIGAAENFAEIRPEIIAAYNHSAGRVAHVLFNAVDSQQAVLSFDGPWRSYRLTTLTEGDASINPDLFDELESAAYIQLKHTDVERIIRDGFGAAMVGYREASAAHRMENPFLSPLGMALPVNATLDFSPDDGRVDLAYHDLTLTEDIDLGGHRVPLAADLTAPLVVPFNNFEHPHIAWKGMLHPDAYADYMRLFQLEPFRAEKVPLILVHGLLSSPHIWLPVFNALNADPVLRERYQLFVFLYPTGFPIGYSAAAFRHRLAQFNEHFDPDNGNPNLKNLLIIGHSMGGVLSSMQIRSSTDSFERTFFDRPIDDLTGVDESQKAALKALLVYQANPSVTRTVFVAAPHRGSDKATGMIGSIGSALIDDSTDTVLSKPLPQDSGLTEAGRQMVEHRLNGIESLVPHSPALLAILDQPIREGVTFHSIIGQKDRELPLAEGTDGTVSYWSSHLDGAASEHVVYDKHTPMVKNQSTIDELSRLLYLHANLPYQKKP
jgi:pimeloyl-ACP methyl ester carboxylesterase